MDFGQRPRYLIQTAASRHPNIGDVVFFAIAFQVAMTAKRDEVNHVVHLPLSDTRWDCVQLASFRVKMRHEICTLESELDPDLLDGKPFLKTTDEDRAFALEMLPQLLEPYFQHAITPLPNIL